MRRLYVCDTPLQLFNACNQQFHEREVDSDLIIVDHFQDAETIAKRLRCLSLFSQICIINYDGLPPKQWLRRRIYNFRHFFFIEKIISKALDAQGFKDYQAYDIVSVSYLIETAIAMLCLNPGARFVLYEDGLGSYGGNLITDFWSERYKFFSRLFRRGCFVRQPKALYLNNVSCCRSELKVPFYSLPPLDEEFLSFVEMLFGKSELPDKRIILLSQPIETGISRKNIEEMIEGLKPFAENTVVRLHPRDKDYTLYAARFETVRARGLWEMIVSHKNIENKILISIGSTAQFIPKILFDREPYIVFFYPFSEGYSMGFGKGMKDMVNLMKETYRQPEKICVPRTFDDVSAFLNNVLV